MLARSERGVGNKPSHSLQRNLIGVPSFLAESQQDQVDAFSFFGLAAFAEGRWRMGSRAGPLTAGGPRTPATSQAKAKTTAPLGLLNFDLGFDGHHVGSFSAGSVCNCVATLVREHLVGVPHCANT